MNTPAVDWNKWTPTERAVLCYIVKEGKVLLMTKKRGLGAGKVNAPGGRIEAGETPRQAAVRETEEEVLVTPHNLKEAGFLRFQFTDGYRLEGRVFTADDYTGTPGPTDEADPFWVPLREIPYEKMWADDILWMPAMFRGIPFHGDFLFDGDTMEWFRLTPGGDSPTP